MPRTELEPQKETYSANDFLHDLETVWEGKLYFDIATEFKDKLSNISAQAYPALQSHHDQQRGELKGILSSSGNIAVDFRDFAISLCPHKGESRDFLHILADPFCRAAVTEELENLFRSCANAQGTESFVVKDQLPFKLEGPDSILFSFTPTLPTIEEYMETGRSRAQELASQLDLTEEQKARLASQIDLALDRFSHYIDLSRLNRGRGLHPMIRIITGYTLAQYYLMEKTLPPKTSNLPQPERGIFKELKEELDANQAAFTSKVISHAQLENPHLVKEIAEILTELSDNDLGLAQYLFCLYYEIFSRSARKQGFLLVEVSEETATNYLDYTRQRLAKAKETKSPIEFGLLIHIEEELLTIEEIGESEELKQFWQHADNLRNNLRQKYGAAGAILLEHASIALYLTRGLLYEQQRKNQP